MRINLKLSQQGLILVGVPTGLMLIFLAALLLLLLKVEREAKEVDRSKTIIARADSLVKDHYDAASQLFIYKATKDEKARKSFEEGLAVIKESFKDLKDLLKNDPKELKMLGAVEASAQRGTALLQVLESALMGHRELSYTQTMILYIKFNRSGADFAAKLRDLITYETARHRINSGEEERGRTLVKAWIIAGACLAIASGTILALLFTRNTTSRLARLMDNTMRLSKKEPLLPMLEGEDEIAQLDRFFHKMAAELAEAARKERAILDNAVDVICSINADGNFTAANRASLQAWGYAPDKLVGLHYSEIVFKEDVQKFRDGLEQIKQDKPLVNLATRVIAPNENLVHILWSLRWSESEQSLFCVAHDISDRIEVEQMKQDFVAMVSHELRTPLASLVGTLNLLSEGAYGRLSDRGEKRVKSAESGISRLVMLINDLLDIEKMESGKLSMMCSDINLADVIERSVESVQGFAENQGVSLRSEKRAVRVLADADRIVQVVVNLLSNAIKFSDDGGEVEIKIADTSDYAEVQVIDHGAGIPAGAEKTIFEKYGQAHSDSSKRRRGTGLGLPICKAIVEQHGGMIGVRSTEGGGSTFWFSLPYVSAPSSAES